MSPATTDTTTLRYLRDLWDEAEASRLEADPVELLRYRSNLLGADLRITNFGGGNTSSKVDLPGPFSGETMRVLAVKGSGGDLGSIRKSGFALLYLNRLHALERRYRGEAHEDEMVAMYPLCTFGESKAPASIDTPLHGFLPFDHVDHLHPDWAIALAASANAERRLAEFNERFHRHLVWVPWQRPGFELGLMLRRAVEANPGCDGIVLGSHGLFTWGNTQRESYLNSITIIDEFGQFVLEREDATLFGGARHQEVADRANVLAQVLPMLRGHLATTRRAIAHVNDHADVLQFVNSLRAQPLAALGTSCPDHFIRTRIRPMFVDWDPATGDIAALKAAISQAAADYRADYTRYYEANQEPGSPALRDPNPSVVLIPGLGMVTLGKNKTEARITGEFYLNAIHVMAGATALGDGPTITPNGDPQAPATLPQARTAEVAPQFTAFENYVALPPREAFRIEYWALEEAKLQRMPPEQRFSRRIFLVVGGGSGIGRMTALQLASQGAHLMIADRNVESAAAVAVECAAKAGREAVDSCALDITDRTSLRAAIRATVLQFGGLDGLINTAAVFLAPDREGVLPDDQWRLTFDVNITGNYLLVDEARAVLKEQGLPSVVVLTSSANAVVPKRGSEAYDVSKTAVNALIRELALSLAPHTRVNGIAPATVVEGSTMFARERVIPSLVKYNIPFSDEESTEELRSKLANFYAQRTLTKQPITPADCAAAICWLASDESGRTTGHVIPVDGGLPEAFLR